MIFRSKKTKSIKNSSKFSVLLIGLLALAMFVSVTVIYAAGQTEEAVDYSKYPEKPIRIIIPYNPGGGTDMLTRGIQKFVDLPFALINIVGASGLIGAEEATRAKPDGYTILGHNPHNFIGNKAVGVTDHYFWRELETIAWIVEAKTLIATSAKTGWKTFEEMADYARKNPGKVKMGMIGTGIHLANALRMIEEMEADIVTVPYDGGAAEKAALLGGHIDLVLPSNEADIKPLVDSGDAIVLAIVSDSRSEFFPDVPTLKEMGYTGGAFSARGYYAPLGTPEPILTLLRQKFKEVTQNEDFIKYAYDLGMVVSFTDHIEANRISEEKYKQWQKIVDETGIKEY